jgi:hypothetical protein
MLASRKGYSKSALKTGVSGYELGVRVLQWSLATLSNCGKPLKLSLPSTCIEREVWPG